MLTEKPAVYHDALRYSRSTGAVHGFCNVRIELHYAYENAKLRKHIADPVERIPRECWCPSNDQLASWQFFGTPDSRYVAPRLHLIFFAAGAKPIDILIAATERRGQRLKRGTRSKGVPIKKKPELCRAGLRFWARFGLCGASFCFTDSICFQWLLD